MFHKLKQFAKLRKQANTLRSKLAEEKVTVNNRAVTLVMDGNQEVKEFKIQPDFMQPDKRRDLEQHAKDAINESVKKAQRVMATKMREMGDFNIPGLSS